MPGGVLCGTRCLILLLVSVLILLGCSEEDSGPSGPGDPGPDPSGPTVLISNLDGMENSNISLDLAQRRSVAVGFTTPNQAYRLDSVILKLMSFQEDAAGLAVRLFDNNSRNNPGTELLTFITPTVPAQTGPQEFTITPPGFTLQANRTYWIVVHNKHSSYLAWTNGNPSTIPTGIATHFGAKLNLWMSPDPPVSNVESIGAYAVVGTVAE